MSLFGSLMGDVEDDPFFGSHMRHMRQMNHMMNTLFADPFGMMGDGPLAITGSHRGNSLMPFMPQIPSLNRLFAADISDGHRMGAGTSFSSSTVVMSSGPSGAPQIFSSSSSTKIGPNGVKETRKTLQDSRSGLKKMSIGHHIGERAHVIEREQNVYSGDAEERQEFINLEEDEAEDFDREFQVRAGSGRPRGRAAPLLALPPATSTAISTGSTASTGSTGSTALVPHVGSGERQHRLQSRRPLRASRHLAPASGVREVYSGSHPQRHRHKHHRHRHSPIDN